MDFRNTYIRLIIRNVFNSKEPWSNPDLSALQYFYDATYPMYPTRLRHSDAVFHPVRANFHGMQEVISNVMPDDHLARRSS